MSILTVEVLVEGLSSQEDVEVWYCFEFFT
jgi:hypothetical protein